MDEAPSAVAEKLDRLERVVRAAGRDSLESVQGSREALQEMRAQLGQVDLLLKDVGGAVERSSRESQAAMERAEQHFAGAIRELEGRVRDEVRFQVYRSAVLAMLPALDDLDLILLHEKGTDDADSGMGLAAAVRLVRQKLVDGLRRLGLEEIAVEPGSTFDPSAQEAAESDLPAGMVAGEDVPRGTILFVRRAGFRLDGRVFRSPQVIVRR